MEVTFRYTRADRKFEQRLQRAWSSAETWFVGAVLAGWTVGTAVLAARGDWYALVAVAVLAILMLLFAVRIRRRRLQTADEPPQTIRLADDFIEKRMPDELHQFAWWRLTSLEATPDYLVLRSGGVLIHMIPKHALPGGEAAAWEARLESLMAAHRTPESCQPVPLWQELQHKPLAASVRYTLQYDDFLGATLHKYEPPQRAGPPPQPGAWRHVGCLLTMTMLGLLVMLGQAQQQGPRGEVAAGVLVVGGAVLLPILALLLFGRLAGRRSLRRASGFFGFEQMMGFDAAGVYFGSPRGGTSLAWRHISHLVHGAKLIGFQDHRNLIYVVPQTAFADQQAREDFLALAAEYLQRATSELSGEAPPAALETGNPFQPPQT